MRFVNLGVGALVLLAVTACNPMVESRGNALDTDRVGQIEPGKFNRAQVASLLGTPSSVAPFDHNTWYYIGRRTEQLAFFQPETVDQKVIMVKFDDDGVVEEIRKFDGDEAREVDLVSRKTPTRGDELSLLGQLYKTLLSGPGGILGGGPQTNDGFIK